jgi:NADP-dependent 3-hydroxy acid dehydrogenase YdfG
MDSKAEPIVSPALRRAALTGLLAAVAALAVVLTTGSAGAQPTPGAERTAAGKAAYRSFVASVRGKPTLVVAFHPL